MKISDEGIVRVIGHAKTMNTYCNASGDHIAQDYYCGVIDVCEELQQRREIDRKIIKKSNNLADCAVEHKKGKCNG